MHGARSSYEAPALSLTARAATKSSAQPAVGESQLEAFAAMARLNAMNDAAVLYRLAAESSARIPRRRLKRHDSGSQQIVPSGNRTFTF